MSSSQIAALNDAFRHSHMALAPATSCGRWIVTRGVAGKGELFMMRAARAVHEHDAFSPDNDPYGEHDFGSFELQGEKLFWKIDCYAKDDFTRGSEDDPADPAQTTRVMTIMLASEY